MKKLLILICCITFGSIVKAQTLEGSLSVLLDESRINFELHFANARIHGMTELEFAKHEEDWYKDMPQIVGDFVNDLNDEMKGVVRFGEYPSARYTLLINVVEVATNGHMDSDAFLINNVNGNIVAKVTGLQAKSAPWGTKLYLIKVAASRSGEKLGELFYKALKKGQFTTTVEISNNLGNVKNKE